MNIPALPIRLNRPSKPWEFGCGNAHRSGFAASCTRFRVECRPFRTPFDLVRDFGCTVDDFQVDDFPTTTALHGVVVEQNTHEIGHQQDDNERIHGPSTAPRDASKSKIA